MEGGSRRVGVAGRGEGGCEEANGVFAGLDGLKINALINKKVLFHPKSIPPNNQEVVILAQNRFYYWGIYVKCILSKVPCVT